MNIKDKVIYSNPTLLLNLTNYSIPANNYASIIYNGATSDMFLPLINECILGQVIDIRNNGTGILTIKTQASDKIKPNSGPVVISYNLNINEYVSFNCEQNWILMEFPTSSSGSNITTTNIATVNLDGNPSGTNINVLSNLNMNSNKILSTPVAIGINAGAVAQVINSTAVGSNAGSNTQFGQSVAIGTQAGELAQGVISSGFAQAVAVGYQAGETSQFNRALAIGYLAGQNNQAQQNISIGTNAGNTNAGNAGLAIGTNAGLINIGSRAIAIGSNAGSNVLLANTIAIGTNCGSNNLRQSNVAIGVNAMDTSPLTQARKIGIGTQAGAFNSGTNAISIGYQAHSQAANRTAVTAIGYQAALISGSINMIAIGYQSASNSVTAASNVIAIGSFAGHSNLTLNSIAIGSNAGRFTQSTNSSNCIRIGTETGVNTVTGAVNCIAIGYQAGSNTAGVSVPVSIGYQAGKGLTSTQPANTIILNATNTEINGVAAQTNRFYVNPVRFVTGATPNLYFNVTAGGGLDTNEIYYKDPSSDARIKKNIEDLDDAECLNILENISAKKFNLVDDPSAKDIYGFIAQDVTAYVPWAVTESGGYLVNIWQTAECTVLENNKLQVTINTTGINITDKIKIVNQTTGEIYECLLESITASNFITQSIENLNLEINTIVNLFIYGTWTNNIMALNEEYLWAVNWGAAQQIIRRIENIENKILSL